VVRAGHTSRHAVQGCRRALRRGPGGRNYSQSSSRSAAAKAITATDPTDRTGTRYRCRRAARVSAGHLTIGIASCLALAAGASAETFDYGIDAGIAETSNVSLLPGNTVSQPWPWRMSISDYKEQTRLLDASLKGNFSYIDYLQNAYDRQLLGRFDGSGRVPSFPERLRWGARTRSASRS